MIISCTDSSHVSYWQGGGPGVTTAHVSTHLPEIILRFMLLRALPGAPPAAAAAARAPGEVEAAGGTAGTAGAAGRV